MKREKFDESGFDQLRNFAYSQIKESPTAIGYSTLLADDLKLLHELQVHQLEMEMQNEELRLDRFRHEEFHKKYLDLFEFAPYGYFTINDTGLIQEVNLTGATLLGINRSALINRLFEKYILPQDQEVFRQCKSILTGTNERQVCDVRISRLDGQQLHLRLTLSFTENKDKFLILVAVSDITITKQIEDVQSFLLSFCWTKSGKDFFESLAEYLGKTLGMDYVCIDKLVDSGLSAQTLAIYFDGHYEANSQYTLNDTPCGKVVGQTVCCFPSRVRHLFPQDVVLQQIDAESYVGITLWGSQGKPIGLIAVIGRRPLADPRSTVAVLKEVSIRAAGELEHRQLEEIILKSRDELEILVQERTTELQKTNERLRSEMELRKQQERSLILAEEKYRTLADFTCDCETWIGPDGKFIYVSPSFNTITGYSAEELMNDPTYFEKIVHPDDREIIEKHYKDTLNELNEKCSFDIRIISASGEVRWIGHVCQSVYNVDGKFLGQRGSNRDITEQKKAESILIESQRQLRALTQRIDAIAEEERTNIAREIHDELGHLLTVIKFDIEGLIEKPDLPIELVKSELNSVISMVDALIDTVKKITSELRPGILDHLGLFPAIEWLIRQLQKRSKICCEFKPGDLDVTFDKNETNIIFRIVQEILTNVVRHSKANKVSVSLNKQDGLFMVKVVDNGIGFDLNEKSNEDSFGLMGMRERALSIGGEIKIESIRGIGTTVIFSLQKN
jgi:PAS domain S-box-containing protein